MGALNKGYDRLLGTGTNSDRLEFFSDAVFAIAMTLLVIDIAVPTVETTIGMSQARANSELWRAIGQQWPQFLAYGLSFFVIGSNWATHRRKFAMTHRFDGRLVTINLLLLFFIAFLPYPTSLISQFGSEVPAVVMYGGVVAAIGLLQYALWAYSFRHGFLDEKITIGVYRYARRNMLVTPIVFLVSIPMGIVFGASFALYFYLVIIPASIIVGRYEPKPPAHERVAASAP